MRPDYQLVIFCQYLLVMYLKVMNTYLMPTSDPPIVAARRVKLRQWLTLHHGGKQKRFIEATGINQGLLSGLLSGKKSFREEQAINLETLARMPEGYLLRPMEESASTALQQDRRKPSAMEGAIVGLISYLASKRPAEAKELADAVEQAMSPIEDSDESAARIRAVLGEARVAGRRAAHKRS